jgi:hypothetical protein
MGPTYKLMKVLISYSSQYLLFVGPWLENDWFCVQNKMYIPIYTSEYTIFGIALNIINDLL